METITSPPSQQTTFDPDQLLLWAKAVAKKHGIEYMLQHKKSPEKGSIFQLQMKSKDQAARQEAKRLFEEAGFKDVLEVSTNREDGEGLGAMFHFLPQNPDLDLLAAIIPEWKSLVAPVAADITITASPPVVDKRAIGDSLPVEFVKEFALLIFNQVVRAGVLKTAGIKAGGDVAKDHTEAELFLSGSVNMGHSLEDTKAILEEAKVEVLMVKEREKTMRLSLQVPVELLEQYAQSDLQEAWQKYAAKSGIFFVVKAIAAPPPPEQGAGTDLPKLSKTRHQDVIRGVIRKHPSQSCFGYFKRPEQSHLFARLLFREDLGAIKEECLLLGYATHTVNVPTEDKVLAIFDLIDPTREIVKEPARMLPPAPEQSGPTIPAILASPTPSNGPGPQETLARLIMQALRKKGAQIIDFGGETGGIRRATVSPHGVFVGLSKMSEEQELEFLMKAMKGE